MLCTALLDVMRNGIREQHVGRNGPNLHYLCLQTFLKLRHQSGVGAIIYNPVQASICKNCIEVTTFVRVT